MVAAAAQMPALPIILESAAAPQLVIVPDVPTVPSIRSASLVRPPFQPAQPVHIGTPQEGKVRHASPVQPPVQPVRAVSPVQPHSGCATEEGKVPGTLVRDASPVQPARAVSPVQPVQPVRAASPASVADEVPPPATSNPTSSTLIDEGKGYVVDVSNKDFPCVLMADRKLTSIGGNVFNLPQRFSITSNLGNGAYCAVVGAKDAVSGEEVAIKKCSYVFARNEDGKRLLREVKLGTGLQHVNVLSLREILVPLESEFNDLYFVCDKMDTDLFRFQRGESFPDAMIQPVMHQVARGLKYIHSARVIHRDLKPDNILIRLSDGNVKVCDFNLSRGFDYNAEPMTANIATRWYRSPELLVDNSRYCSAIDIWSLGCVFAEMFSGKTLFPGDTPVDMLDRILRIVDVDESTDLAWIESDAIREHVKRAIAARVEGGGRASIADLLPSTINPQALVLLNKMLRFVPSERCTASDVLNDPYISARFSDAGNLCDRVFKWKWDNLKPNDATLRHLFWLEIAKMHPEVQQQRSTA